MDRDSQSAAAPVLEARCVSRRYGNVVALEGVSLSVRAGETVALVGESGSGKTTLLRLFNGMELPDQGEVFVRGRRVADQDPTALRRSIGYVQQEGGLMPHWTLRRNVALVPRLLGLEASETERRVEGLLARLGLGGAGMSDRFPAELSGGQRQRVALARALAADPEVVLLDEPFGALDALTRHDMHRLFLDMAAEFRKTMLLVTHDLEEAFLLADRIAVLRGGRIVQCADEATLRSAPADAYVTDLLRRGAPR